MHQCFASKKAGSKKKLGGGCTPLPKGQNQVGYDFSNIRQMLSFLSITAILSYNVNIYPLGVIKAR